MFYQDDPVQHPIFDVLIAKVGEPVPWEKPLPNADEHDTYFMSGPITAVILEGGMASGKPSVTFRIDLPDGRVVLAQTSPNALEMLLGACRGVEQRGS